MDKPDILIDNSKCAGCLLCQLLCSFTYTGAFNLEKTAVSITETTGCNEIAFNENCVKGCSLCARYCVYGAISLKQKVRAAR